MGYAAAAGNLGGQQGVEEPFLDEYMWKAMRRARVVVGDPISHAMTGASKVRSRSREARQYPDTLLLHVSGCSL